MVLARRLAGMVALVCYLVMGALLYFTVLPGVGGAWPPDFYLRGYNVASISGFVEGLHAESREAYGVVMTLWDRVFIVALAVWIALVGWRGNGIRYVVAGLAVIYALINLAEAAAIYRFVWADVLDPAMVSAASHLTMAKFSSLYLSILVLIVHLRRTE